MRWKIAVFLGGSIAAFFFACVSDSAPPPPDSGGPDTSTPPPDTSVPNDTGAPIDAGIDVFCIPGPPQLFAAVPDAGPFCGAKTHCNLGQPCCVDIATNGQACAGPTCTSPSVSIGCYSKAECPTNQVCCGTATASTTICGYATLSNFKQSSCQALCSGELVMCASSAECGSKVCTPTRLINPTNTATSTVQAGVCL